MSGLEQQFPGRVKAHNLDATTEQAKKTVSDLGFQNHGLVIRSDRGEVLWKQPDHSVVMEDVRAELSRLCQTD